MPDTPEGKTLLAHLQVLVKWLLFMCVIITVLVVGSLARSFVVQDAADHATAAAERSDATSQEARTAAIEARDELRTAIEATRRNNNEPDVQNQAILDALAAIARIEEYLCGGPCPP